MMKVIKLNFYKTNVILLWLSALFLLLRLLLLKYTGDAQNLVAFFLLIYLILPKEQCSNGILQWHGIAEKALKQKIIAGFDFIISYPFFISCLFFLWLLFSHAILGLGIHIWQGYDLTFFIQSSYNAFHRIAPLYQTIEGQTSFFKNHFEPFLFLFHPVAKLADAPFFFYLIQDAFQALFLGMAISFLKNFSEISKQGKYYILFLLLTNPFWAGVIRYEFHEMALVAPLVLAAYFCFFKNRAFLLFILCILLLIFKETLCFVVAWSAILIFVYKPFIKWRIVAIILFLLAVANYYLYFHKILPQYSGTSDSNFMKYYKHLGNTQTEVIFSPFIHPIDWLKAMFQLQNITWIIQWIMAGGVVVLGGVFYLLPIIPEVYVILLSYNEHLRDVRNQYGGVIIASLFVAMIMGYKLFFNCTYINKNTKKIILSLCICFAISTVDMSPIRTMVDFFTSTNSGLASRSFVKELRNIDKNLTIVSNNSSVLPFIAQRDNFVLSKEAIIEKPKENVAIIKIKANENYSWFTECQKQINWANYVICFL